MEHEDTILSQSVPHLAPVAADRAAAETIQTCLEETLDQAVDGYYRSHCRQEMAARARFIAQAAQRLAIWLERASLATVALTLMDLAHLTNLVPWA